MELDIYLRISRIGDEKQRSIEGQEADSRARVADVGAEVGEVHADRGRSAWNPRVRRPGWDLLLRRLESGATGGVVVFDLERFSRQPAEGERLLAAAGNGLRVLDSDSEYDLTSPSGRKAFRDQMAAAAYYSDRLSSRVKRGKRIKAANGEVDKRRSFGFEPDGVTLRADEAAIIREHARRLLAGETQDALIRELNEDSVPSVRGAKWGYTTYRQIMTRPRNAGLIVHSGAVVEDVRLPAAILDDDTYHRLVALYAARRRGRQPSGRYVLTGLAVCGLCNAGLGGRPVTGTTRRLYWCKACHRISVEVARLDEWAGNFAQRELSDPASAEALARAERERNEIWAEISAQVAAIEADALAVADRFGRGEMSLSRYDAITGPLDRRLAVLRAELEGLEAVQPEGYSPVLTPRAVAELEFLSAWQEGSALERRALVVRALRGRKLIVGPGRSARFDSSRVSVS